MGTVWKEAILQKKIVNLGEQNAQCYLVFWCLSIADNGSYVLKEIVLFQDLFHFIAQFLSLFYGSKQNR